MSDLNMQLVREFFELNLFHVLTHWRHEAFPHVADPGYLLFVEHTNPELRRDVDFLLRAEDIPFLYRAVVEVRAWHAERFYASIVENNSVLGHVASEEIHALAENVFGDGDFTTILVISELPASAAPKAKTLELLREMKIGHIIEFPTILQDMLSRLNADGNYAPSQTLQTLRLLKRYNFIRRQQLEFPFRTEAPPAINRPSVQVETQTEDFDFE